MRTKDFAFVALKVLAIYIFFRAITELFASINFWVFYLNQPGDSTQGLTSMTVLVNFLAAAFLLLMCHLLWQFTGKIVSRIVPKDSNIEEQGKWDIKLETLQAGAFIVVGVIILSNAVPNIFHVAVELIEKKARLFPVVTEGKVNRVSIDSMLKIIGHLVYLLIGIFLVFRGKDILRIIKKLRRE